MNGAKAPPAPIDAPRPEPSANWALPSDCFWKPTARTRPWRPVSTRCDATMPVVPPTEPAVCTRNIGFPVAPSASVRYSSGFMMPSKRSGALPTTTASMSLQVISASSSARSAASRTRPPSDTSQRRVLCSVWPMPTIAHGWWLTSPLLRGRTRGSAAGTGPTSSARACAAGRDRGSAARPPRPGRDRSP